MTYSQGGQSYPPAQQHGPYAPTTQFAKPDFTKDDGETKLPVYLLAAVVAFGLACYLVSFGPVWKSSEMGSVGGTSITGGSLEIVAPVLAALLAGIGLLPKQRNYTAIVAAVASVGFLLVLSELINKPSFLNIGWALIAIVVLAGLQAIAAVGALLLDADVITAPQPRPKYDQFQGYGGQYYGQPGQPQQHAPQPQQNFQQRGGYPQYGGYPSGPPAGGFPGQPGPPTPPTGFPTYGPASPSAPTQAMPQQQPQQQQQPPQQQQQHENPSSAQSGPAPS